MWTKTFIAYISTRFAAMFSMQMLLLVLGLTLYDLTLDPFMLGLAGLVVFVPGLALVFVSGVASDMLSRSLVSRIAFVLVAAVALTLAWLGVSGALTPFAIFTAFFCAGLARTFYNPALKSLVANVVPIEHVPSAIAVNATVAKAAGISGPVLGGFLYAADPVWSYLVPGVGMLAATLSASFLGAATARQGRMQQVKLSDMVGGVKAILTNRLLFSAMMLDLVAVILGGATALLPVYGREVLHVGAGEIGVLRAAPAVGTLLAAVLLFWLPLRCKAGLVMLGAMAGYGFSIALFGLSKAFLLSALALCAAGAFDMISIYVRESLIQLRTPDEMRGRVNAINLVFNTGANELGDFRAGTMAALFGAVPAVVFGGLCSVAIAGIWARRYPELRRMDRP